MKKSGELLIELNCKLKESRKFRSIRTSYTEILLARKNFPNFI